MNIFGKRVVIRAIETEDLPKLHEWMNDTEVCRNLGEIHFPSSMYQQERWFDRIQNDTNTIRLAVQTQDCTLIGYTGFWDINWRDRHAEHGLIIGDPKFRGQGFGRDVILACARYAFQEMDLYRLDANIIATNLSSLKAYEYCGFQIEGVLRGHVLRRGQRVNRVLLGLLSTEHDIWVKRTRYWDT